MLCFCSKYAEVIHTEDDRQITFRTLRDSPDRDARRSAAGYRSSVCSTPDPALDGTTLDGLAAAIDQLALANRDGADPADLAERIARLWTMIGDLDPELARRRSAYEIAAGAPGAQRLEWPGREWTRAACPAQPGDGASSGQKD